MIDPYNFLLIPFYSILFPQGDIPVVPLNFVMISLDGPFSRDTVEGCVKETLLYLSRIISIKQNVEFTFKGIGVLVIRDSKVKMRFYKDFLCTMDGSGTLMKALANVNGFSSLNVTPNCSPESLVCVMSLTKAQLDIF